METIELHGVLRPTAAAAGPRLVGTDLAAGLSRAGHEATGLPVLRPGARLGPVSEDWAAIALMLQAALWSLACARDIPVRGGASMAEAARLLVGYGAVIPPAGDAVQDLAPVLAAGLSGALDDPALARRASVIASRLSGYLELRARFG